MPTPPALSAGQLAGAYYGSQGLSAKWQGSLWESQRLDGSYSQTLFASFPGLSDHGGNFRGDNSFLCNLDRASRASDLQSLHA